MFPLLAAVIVLVALAVLFLGINIFFFRRKFPETEIGKNKNMIRLGLKCPQCEERMNFRRTIHPSNIDPRRLQPDWPMLVK